MSGLRKGSRQIAVIKSNRDTATDDQKDRFFNRGRYALA